MRRLLCWLLGHGPWIAPVGGFWHEGELRKGRECSMCGARELDEVIG
jgi:hypothetical protein